ncbi:MAG: hypothetical protein ON057_001064 [Glomeribacter sp. 1016415]|nr:hypothetical protein [Glomeribacter sp. 1016415]
MLLEQCQNQSQKENILRAIESSDPSQFQERHLIYQKWQRDENDQAAIKSLGNLYSNSRPSTCPVGVTYRQYWEAFCDIWWPDGSQNPKNLIAELQQKNSIPHPENKTKNCSEPVSENNVFIITRLPKQGNEEKSEIIFIDHNTLQQQIENGETDPSRSSFELVKTGLTYGNITIQPGDTSSNKVANLRFNQHNIDYHIQLTFNNTGHVSNLEINESESITFFLNT